MYFGFIVAVENDQKQGLEMEMAEEPRKEPGGLDHNGVHGHKGKAVRNNWCISRDEAGVWGQKDPHVAPALCDYPSAAWDQGWPPCAGSWAEAGGLYSELPIFLPSCPMMSIFRARAVLYPCIPLPHPPLTHTPYRLQYCCRLESPSAYAEIDGGVQDVYEG